MVAPAQSDHTGTSVEDETTDATATVVASFTPPNNTITIVNVDIVGAVSNNSANKGVRAKYSRAVTKDTAGTVNIRGTGGEETWGTSGYTVVVANNAGTIEIRVTGAASETVGWGGRVFWEIFDYTISGGA